MTDGGNEGTTRRVGLRWRVLTRRVRVGDTVLATGASEFTPARVFELDGDSVGIELAGGLRVAVPWFAVYALEEIDP